MKYLISAKTVRKCINHCRYIDIMALINLKARRSIGQGWVDARIYRKQWAIILRVSIISQIPKGYCLVVGR